MTVHAGARRGCRSACVGSTILLALCAAPAGGAGFGVPHVVSPPGTLLTGIPRIAQSVRGRLAIAYTAVHGTGSRRRFVVQARLRTGGRLGPVREWSGDDVRVAVGPDGTAVAVSSADVPARPDRGEGGTISIAIARPGDRAFRAPRVVATAGPCTRAPDSPTALAECGRAVIGPVGATIDTRGQVTAVWWRDPLDVPARPVVLESATAPAGGAFGAPQLVTADGIEQSRLATDRLGTAWLSSFSPVDGPRLASLPAGAASFGPPLPLVDSGVPQWAATDAIAVGPGGSAVVYNTLAASGREDFRLRPIIGPQSLGAAEPIPDPDPCRGRLRCQGNIPAAALPAGGMAVAAWDEFSTPAEGNPDWGRIRAAIRPASGVFAPPLALSAPGMIADSEPAIAASGSATTVAWNEHDRRGAGRVMYRVMASGGSFGRPRRIARIAGEKRGSDAPQISAAGTHLTLAWATRLTSGNLRGRLAIADWHR